MYGMRYCLKWRFSLIVNSLRVSTCLTILGRAPFILKLPWYQSSFCEGRAQQITASGVIAHDGKGAKHKGLLGSIESRQPLHKCSNLVDLLCIE